MGCKEVESTMIIVSINNRRMSHLLLSGYQVFWCIITILPFYLLVRLRITIIWVYISAYGCHEKISAEGYYVYQKPVEIAKMSLLYLFYISPVHENLGSQTGSCLWLLAGNCVLDVLSAHSCQEITHLLCRLTAWCSNIYLQQMVIAMERYIKHDIVFLYMKRKYTIHKKGNIETSLCIWSFACWMIILWYKLPERWNVTIKVCI